MYMRNKVKDVLLSNVIYGKDFDGEITAISDIEKEQKSVILLGRVFSVECRNIKSGKVLLMFSITDYSDSIKVKIFVDQKQLSELEYYIWNGQTLMLLGNVVCDAYDRELCMQNIAGIYMVAEHVFSPRIDNAPQKRVELHCHTNKSDMDGISDARDIIKQAYKWGMSALAITDHAVVQGLTDGYHYIEEHINTSEDADKRNFKLILGVEGYLVDCDINDPESIKRNHSSHVVILARNEQGRINLYRLVSESHLHYFYRKPLIPRKLLEQYRKNLIIGSACCAGELYKAIVNGSSEDELWKIVEFYDYLEIQPIANNRFMIADARYPNINSDNDLKDINKSIVRLGDKYNKPVVATCDAHFLNPEDEIFRSIILNAKDMAEEPAPLYLRTTEEMLTEFEYLGEEKAREIVIENTNAVSDLCENISPVRADKCPPVIENSDEILRNTCLSRAHDLYGENLPDIIKDRLDRELDSIIGNGYSVLYIIAQKLVNKSLEEGYLVGSRGSVGSSLAAFMAGITEVNPLPPHYLCPKCRHSDFDSDVVRSHKGNSGCDMPDVKCPVCGALMKKAGFDIPFETFLGFKGDKEPDIDLNFSGEVQVLIQKYTEEIFGKGNCFKAGTMATIAEKTAYGFVKKYLQDHHISKRRAEIERLAWGCVGVKRGTGQHPGGIIILPKGEEIYSFTPIQYPANDRGSVFITTHFDYHSIDHNLLKLDLLGHDDPTMLKFLHDCTGVDPKSIPLDDPKVMELFKNTKSIGVSPDQIGGVTLGCLGIPEFGTDFAMSMVMEAKPESFSDLIRLSGLAHGTDVWIGNARDLISDGTAQLSSCICSRDDIMEYLIQKGMDNQLAFTIMENVRKGRGLSQEMESAMRNVAVPEWYIQSCQKIKYMFPKAHAAAYVMMAWRIAYYKIYYPQAFYCAWFSIRAKTLDYQKMFQGICTLRNYLSRYRSQSEPLTVGQKDEYAAMRVAEEMYERGIEIEPINYSQASAVDFRIIGNKVMPSLVSICGLGEKAAEQIIISAKEAPFSSVEDFKTRTKCPQMVIDNMKNAGLFRGMAETSQMSIFDFME